MISKGSPGPPRILCQLPEAQAAKIKTLGATHRHGNRFGHGRVRPGSGSEPGSGSLALEAALTLAAAHVALLLDKSSNVALVPGYSF